MIQAALNGGRDRNFHAAVPITPEELAADAAAVVAAGAAALHVHPRAPDGRQSLMPEVVDAALAAIRRAVPGIPVGISTGQWIAPFGRERITCLGRLWERPDYVSVNMPEGDAAEIIDAALAHGIGVEVGIYGPSDVESLASLPDARRCLRLLVEIIERPEQDPVGAFEDVMAAIEKADLGLPVLVHGMDESFWPVCHAALARGLDLRVGLEDGRLLPDGSVATDNAALVAALSALVQSGTELLER